MRDYTVMATQLSQMANQIKKRLVVWPALQKNYTTFFLTIHILEEDWSAFLVVRGTSHIPKLQKIAGGVARGLSIVMQLQCGTVTRSLAAATVIIFFCKALRPLYLASPPGLFDLLFLEGLVCKVQASRIAIEPV